MQRERHRLDDSVPMEGLRPASRIGDIIPMVMKHIGLESQEWMQELVDGWADVVGENVAAHARPGRVDGGTLVVFVDSSVWLSELARYGKRTMLTNLQTRFGRGKIKDVIFRIDPDKS